MNYSRRTRLRACRSGAEKAGEWLLGFEKDEAATILAAAARATKPLYRGARASLKG